MNPRIAIFAMTAMLIAATPVGSNPTGDTAKEPDHQALVNKIKKKLKARSEKYPGAYSKRDVQERVYDPDNGELESSRDFLIEVWDFRGKRPATKFLSCKINGEVVDPEDCRQEQQSEPPHDVFGDDADEHYRIEYGGTAEWREQSVHALEIVPLENTQRHAKGKLYFDRDDLDLVGMDITIADYPFGLEDLSIQMGFKKTEEGTVLDDGVTKLQVYVPLFMHNDIVTKFTASDQRLLKKDERPSLPGDDSAAAS